ncbi:right-handed parallel beta-helix repeat-containing protein [Sphingomonas sp. C3-2]|uniref:right-handed parallel beta-helix repeat-containing protein n=1 Tax=Sphingomonas sp. C3-2 TaxID=3062169 RepID=UPI00294AFD56|nr:right-handed parallel beta-helix repeat-containing protein [Sphingomonas sp. C3-2]WOK35612.1 right-handed parallel beta-helix repeat-containing protein [Sphingomonas sp. C3-2]
MMPAVLALLCAGQSHAEDGEAVLPFVHVETGIGHARLADAVAAIGAGEGTIRIAPGSYRDCAEQTAGTVRYQAQIPGQTIFDGTACPGGGVLVLAGQGAEVDGIIFQNIMGDAAAIRLVRGGLTVRNAMFRNSARAIMAGADPAARIWIDRSSFAELGPCTGDGACGSALETSYYGTVIISRSAFEKGRQSHYVKTRALRVDITGSRFDDAEGQATGYLIDLPMGATGAIRSNSFVLGRSKAEAGGFVGVSTQSRDNVSDGLFITDNKAALAGDVPRILSFVQDASLQRVTVAGNELAPGILSREAQ